MKSHIHTVTWTIVGAGPAGIAAVGQLLDSGVMPQDILWIDPYFRVGDLGRLWQNVSSNTTVALFTAFLESTKSFRYDTPRPVFALEQLNPKATCELKHMVEVLQWVSNHLIQLIPTLSTTLLNAERKQGFWVLQDQTTQFKSKNVILCTGAEPKTLDFLSSKIITFETAIDKQRLEAVFDSSATYGVFGSSHSAIMVLRHLVELGAKEIINFYQSPCCYAIPMGNHILFDNTGLKGQTAAWAAQNIDGILPKNLRRYQSTSLHLDTLLPKIDKVIYAIGFLPRHALTISGIDLLKYNPHTGIIAPGLFGLGIAYPQLKEDVLGNREWHVGIWKFMTYLKQVLPYWLEHNRLFSQLRSQAGHPEHSEGSRFD